MKSVYVHLSSEDSLEMYPRNNSFDFIVELPEPLDKEYSVALVDFNANVTEDLYVFCDIIESSYCRDQNLPLLRIVSTAGEVNRVQLYKSSRSSIQRIKIYIRDKDLKVPTNSIGPVRCSLLFIPRV